MLQVNVLLVYNTVCAHYGFHKVKSIFDELLYADSG